MTTTTTVRVERTVTSIRAALAEHSPQDCARFEAELRDALSAAAADSDLESVDAALTRWHHRAVVSSNPLTADEQKLVRRARSGNATGLRTRDEHGNWTTL